MTTTLREIRATKEDLRMPELLGPGTHKFERSIRNLHAGLAFDVYGRDFILTEQDEEHLNAAYDVCLEYDPQAKVWRFVWRTDPTWLGYAT